MKEITDETTWEELAGPEALSVVALLDKKVKVAFENGVTKVYDVRRMDNGKWKFQREDGSVIEPFKVLMEDDDLFMQVRLECGYTIVWGDNFTDLGTNTVWDFGETVKG